MATAAGGNRDAATALGNRLETRGNSPDQQIEHEPAPLGRRNPPSVTRHSNQTVLDKLAEHRIRRLHAPELRQPDTLTLDTRRTHSLRPC